MALSLNMKTNRIRKNNGAAIDVATEESNKDNKANSADVKSRAAD